MPAWGSGPHRVRAAFTEAGGAVSGEPPLRGARVDAGAEGGERGIAGPGPRRRGGHERISTAALRSDSRCAISRSYSSHSSAPASTARSASVTGSAAPGASRAACVVVTNGYTKGEDFIGVRPVLPGFADLGLVTRALGRAATAASCPGRAGS